MKNLPLLLPAVLLFGFTACDAPSDYSSEAPADMAMEEMADMSYSMQPPPLREVSFGMEEVDANVPQPGGLAAGSSISQPPAALSDTVQKQIIKTASLVYEVKELQRTSQKVDSLVKRFNGYISSSNQNNSTERHELNLTLRVPSRHFDGLMKALGTLPERIDHKSIDAQDVTEQYIDLRSRLQTKKKVEKRYQELLQKANTVKEILEVEEKLRQLQEEIEAKEGQLRYLSHQVGYSTVHLNLYEVQKYEYLPSRTPHFGQRLLGSLDDGWQLLLGLVLMLFRLWPVLGVAVVVVLGVKKYRKRTAKDPSKTD